jgi:antitoxin PrlF
MLAQPALEAESTLTDRFQTTVPGPVRQALQLGKKDKIKYVIQSDDPVLEQFLSFLALDMQQHPEKLQPLTSSMQQSVASLVANVDIDLDEPLSAEDE